MDSAPEPRSVRPRRCPRCRRPSVWRYRPFCSEACRDRDLLDWLTERHVVPGGEAEPAIWPAGGEEAGEAER